MSDGKSTSDIIREVECATQVTLLPPGSGGEPRGGAAGLRLGPGLPTAGRMRRQPGQVHAKVGR